jgi:O-antigen ligase
MKNFFSIKILSNKSNVLKVLFYFFPIIMLCSSGYITAYVTILTIFALYYFLSKNIKIKISILDYLVLFFFLSSVTSTLLNIKEIGGFIFLKSILDIRFLFFFLLTRLIIQNEIIDIKKLSFICLFSVAFLSINIFSQHIIGYDIFGHPPIDSRYNGLFESEAIAGSYIQKFTLLSMLCIFLSNSNKKIKSLFIIILIIFFGLGILMSLDRMPLLIFLFSIAIVVLIFKEFRITFILGIILFLLVFQIFFNKYDIIKNRYLSLVSKYEILKIEKYLSNKESNNEIINNLEMAHGHAHNYLKLYYTSYKIFLENPFFGTGVKSYGIQCNKLIADNKRAVCLSHPHNIYLEIIVNQGIVGLLIFITFISILLKKYYSNFFLQKKIKEDFLIRIFFFSLIISELLPFRSYGSIFQTVNGTFFWFFLALISSKIYIKK